VESFPRTCIETNGPHIFRSLYISNSFYCVHKTLPLVPILLDWSLSTTGPYLPPLIPILSTGHYASSPVRILQHWSLPSTTGIYFPPLVHILYHWSLSSNTGLHPLLLTPILHHWSPSSTIGPYLLYWSISPSLVPNLHPWFLSSNI